MDGLTTVQFVVATGITLVVFAMLANVVVDLYARGVVRAAVDEGARAGAPIDAGPDECERRATEVLRNLLGGPLGRDVSVECRSRRDTVAAAADVKLHSWFAGLVPDWSFDITGSATKEREP